MTEGYKDEEEIRAFLSRIVHLALPLFEGDEEDPDRDMEKAVRAEAAMIQVFREFIDLRREQLRTALHAVLVAHRMKFPLNGPCRCAACENGVKVLTGGN